MGFVGDCGADGCYSPLRPLFWPLLLASALYPRLLAAPLVGVLMPVLPIAILAMIYALFIGWLVGWGLLGLAGRFDGGCASSLAGLGLAHVGGSSGLFWGILVSCCEYQ